MFKDDEILKSVTWELKEGEFKRLYELYEKIRESKGLSKDTYDFDDFMSDIFTLFLNKLHKGELELIVNGLLEFE